MSTDNINTEHYLVSARKYRPSTFRSVVGQQNLTATLKGAIESGRLAHAYLFCGSRGVGKTSCARIFARTINCLNPTPEGEACGQCESCQAIDRGNSFNIIELDAASNNGVNDIRAITEQVAVPPQIGKYRVFIIDEVHMLSASAFNAFLKTLEEPPSYVIFILATTEKHKVLPTILSRCQIYDFKRITINDIVDHLAYVAESEGITADRRALGVIARKADGAMRDALSIFDQVATSAHGKLTYEAAVENLNVLDYDYFFRLVDTFVSGHVAQALLLYKEIRDHGFDSLFFINSLAQHIRDLMVAADPRTTVLLETPDDVAQRLVEQAKSLPIQWYYAAMKLLNDCDLNYRSSSNKQLLVELTLIRLCQLLSPAQPPFDNSDRPVALRNPSEAPRATTKRRQPTEQPAEQLQAEQQPVAPSAAKEESVKTATPAARSVASHRPRSFDISRVNETHLNSIERRNSAYTAEQLAKALNDFAQQMPDQQLFGAAVRTAVIKLGADNQAEILMSNPAQIQAMETVMAKLLPFVHDSLQNDYLTLKPIQNPDVEVPKHLPPAEFLKKTAEENPALASFLRDLDIEVVI